MLNDQLVISDVTGPFREPREPVLSYDYSVTRDECNLSPDATFKVTIPS